MIGKVAQCLKQGRLGVITAIKIDEVNSSTVIYQGIGFDGKAWETSVPKVRACTLDEFISGAVNKTDLKLDKDQPEEIKDE